jgi:hypothetical protein
VFTYDGTLIHLTAAIGWTEEEVATIRSVFPIAPGRGSVTARAILTRSVAHIEDMSSDPEFAYPSLVQTGGPYSAFGADAAGRESNRRNHGAAPPCRALQRQTN